MSNATITLIIIGVMCIMYIVDRFPVALVTLLGMLAMIYCGVLPYQTAFSNFGSTPVLLTAGMVIIINAIIDSGVILRFEHVLQRLSKNGEKQFGTAVLISAGIISMFTNNSALVVMFMPFIASLARSTKGKVTKKHIYLPLAVGGLIGGTGTLAGSTAPLLANEVLEITGQQTFSFFTTAPVALSVLLVTAVCYYLFLYDLSVKWFDFDEVETTGKIIEGPDFSMRNAVISLCVFAAAVVCFILRPFGWDLGLVAITGAAIVVLLKCVDGKEEMRHMMWSALLTLGSALAVADGFVRSGAGDVVIAWLMRVFGDVVTNGKFMVALFLLAGWLLSMFMSNGSLVSMLASVGVPLAVSYGVNPIPVAIACVMGANLAMATPVATTTITMVQVAGYRFKDYFRFGGLVGVIGVVTAWASIVLIYGL